MVRMRRKTLNSKCTFCKLKRSYVVCNSPRVIEDKTKRITRSSNGLLHEFSALDACPVNSISTIQLVQYHLTLDVE